MLRQAKNRVRIEGLLSEIDLKYGSYQKNGATVDTIGGNIKVRVNQTINGENKTLEVPVYLFANKYKNNGDPNPAFTSIETVMKDYVSIAATGSEVNADKVRITGANIRMNEYPSTRDGHIVSFPRINASFVSKATGEFRPEATWELEFAISSMDFLTDNEGVELDPKKLRIKVIVPQYGGKVDTMELVAENPGVIDAITTYWENQKTYTAKGRLNFTTVTREVIEECDFGEPDVKVFTSTISELVVTKGTQSPMEDEMAFAPAELAAALKEHKAYLESLKEKTNTRPHHAPAPANSAANAPFDLGF